jgi:hypothetical protein
MISTSGTGNVSGLVPTLPTAITVGVDIGQRVDFTAIVVTEASERPSARLTTTLTYDRDFNCYVPSEQPEVETVFTARLVERLPLGTPYAGVAERIATIVRNVYGRFTPEAQRTLSVAVVVDATGVGNPVVELIRTVCAELPCSITGATFTYGQNIDGVIGGYELRVGKAALVSRLQVLLQGERLRLPVTPDADIMRRELLDYEIRVDTDAHEKFGAFAVGTHDDLVTALGLACLQDPLPFIVVSAGW